jgi:aryl-alcohol dehydrogenase-like predicted oxidoreductase
VITAAFSPARRGPAIDRSRSFRVVMFRRTSDGLAHLGPTGLTVSRLALGTMNFGELTDESASFSIMDEALDAGINFFDTADVYGGPQSPDMEKGFGISEEIIGRWLAQGGRRDRIVLATKVYQPMGPGRTIADCRLIISAARAKPACAG